MGEWKETSIGRLPVDWEVGLFEADLKIQGRIGWKGYKQTDLVEEGPFVIGGTEINSSIHLDLSSAPHLSREKYEESPEIMLGDKDVLLVTRGNLGQVGLYRKEYGEATINPSVIILKEFVGHPEFLFYYLISRPGNYNVMSLASGSSVPAIYQSEVKSLEYPKPPLSEQRAIASVLSSLDAKIDLLHRQNKTLEAMAETLFRQWFVEEAEEGWEEKAIDEIATRVACGPFGSSIKTDTFASEGVPIISGQHLWGVLMEDNTFNYITREHAEKLSKAKVRRGDVIFTHAGSIGQAALIPDTSRYEEYVLSQRQFFMRCDRTKVLPLYIAMYFHTREGKHALLANTSTSGVPSIARPVSFLRSMVIPVPPIEVQKEFVRVAGSFYDKFQANMKETNTLTKLRDTLLPKLMSGEVRVKEENPVLDNN